MSRALALALLLGLTATPARAEAPPVWLLSWGSRGHADGQFSFPNDVCVDLAGNVLVADYHHHTIKTFDPNGNYLGRFGSPGYGSGGLDGCWSVATDANGFSYVADPGNDLVQKFAPGGAFLVQWSLPASAGGPDLLALDVSPAGDVYVTDPRNNVHQFTSNGTHVRSWPIRTPQAPGTTYSPEIAVGPGGDVFAYDAEASAIRRFDASGNLLGDIDGPGIGEGWTIGGYGFSVDPSGTLWTVSGSVARHHDASGGLLSEWGSAGSGPGQFNGACGIAVGGGGFIYVVDKYNNRIQKFGPAATAARRTSWGRLKSIYR